MARLFTGFQPSGKLHIGNYFGALKPTVELCKQHEGLVCVVDYHALTTVRNPQEMQTNIVNTTKDYLAAGLDSTKAVIFQQSKVQEHTELAWILECLVSVSFLELGHAYKDKVAKGLEATAGLFNYPMLMAADILLYNTDVVPVGEDQRQHLEYAREAAAKFNNAYGETFKEPKELIQKEIAVIPGTDGKKMSKSYGNTIPLFGTKDEIAKAVMSIVTASDGKPEILHAIHKNFRTESELESPYTKGNNFKELKEMLIENIETLIAPMREKRNSISDDDVKKVLADGSAQAREYAAKKMNEVRAKIGVAI
jgi:tryptophanyl-tRNA synthetase